MAKERTFNNVFVSVGKTFTPEQEQFVLALFDLLKSQDLIPRCFGRTDWTSTEPLKSIDDLMGECQGSVIIAFERLHIEIGQEFRGAANLVTLNGTKLATSWNQVEIAMAYRRRHPVLVVMEQGLRKDGLLDKGFNWYIQDIELDACVFREEKFRQIFSDWKDKVQNYKVERDADELLESLQDLSFGDIRRLITTKSLRVLWPKAIFVASVIALVFGAGGATTAFLKDARAYFSARDDSATLASLRHLSDESINYGDPKGVILRTLLDSYLDKFSISRNPGLNEAVTVLRREVAKRANADSKMTELTVDGDLRSIFETFKQRVGNYAIKGEWF